MMNKRIKELAEQAGIYNLELTDETEYWILEKFAELIVGECVDVCINKYAKSDNMSRQSGINFAKDIKKHFGVEE